MKIVTWKDLDIEPKCINNWEHQRAIMQHLKRKHSSLHFEDVGERYLPTAVMEYCDKVIYNGKVLKHRFQD